MPRRSKAAPAAATSSRQAYSRRTDPPRPFYVSCRACRDGAKFSILGDSTQYKGTFIVKDREVVVLSNSPENRGIKCHWEAKTRTKLTKADGKYCPVSCAECGADIGRIYSYLPFYPDVEGVGRVALFNDCIVFGFDIPEFSSGTQTPTSLHTDEQSEMSQSQEESARYQDSDDQVEDEPENQHEDQLDPEDIAEDILSLKRFCLTLDENQETLSKRLQNSQNSTQTLQNELTDLKDTFKSFETRLSAVESSVQNRLRALESALQIILENQTQNHLSVAVADVQSNNVETTSRRSNISVEIPAKRRHRSPSPKPVVDQQSQNISPPLSEEPTDESNKDTTSESKQLETRGTRGTKSQPRQAESTNPSNAQEAGGDEEKSRQARDEEGTRAETSIVISDDESDYDDKAEYTVEHASKRARLNKKDDKKKQQQQSTHAKKKRGRPSIGSSAKQELRIDKPDVDEDYDDEGMTRKVTRYKRSS